MLGQDVKYWTNQQIWAKSPKATPRFIGLAKMKGKGWAIVRVFGGIWLYDLFDTKKEALAEWKQDLADIRASNPTLRVVKASNKKTLKRIR